METKPDPKLRSRLILQLLALAAICLLAVLLLVQIGAFRSPAKSHAVKLRVESSGGFALITYSAGSEGIHDAKYVSVPWTKSFHLKSGSEVYVTAANPSQTGKVACKITLDEQIWKQQTASKSDGSVACAGIVP